MKFSDMFKDDVTKQWSFARISAALAFIVCLFYTAWLAWETKKVPDFPTGWLTYVIAAYGLNKASSTAITTSGG